MAPAYWYGLLGLIGLIIFTVTLWKVKNQRVFAVYTFIAGLIYCMEYFILVLFRSYEYYPHIISNKYFDNILGSIFSNAVIVPMTAAMIGTLQLGWRWILLVIGIILSIEKLFLWLEIYQHFWWRIYYTAIGLVICFFLAKVWDKKLQGEASFLVHLFTLFLSNFLFQASAFYLLVATGNMFLFHIGWFSNPIRDHFAFASAYIFCLNVIYVMLVIKRISWKWRVAAIVLITVLNGYLIKEGILTLSTHWSLIHFFILYLILFLILETYDRWCFSSNNNNIGNSR
ncbi:hypothetical protein [Ammoniphilus resinae]|uniref:Uncharacterized protein n=1 Tax=Ammoniphilus resinae TaxID=861532 RepID=A0ABS4GSV9_9BACL|nr:hypothetical protein [Ammoniphilus resinae]MBP1933378.1 hypothetical protein [Ammoniphilus resinae]